MRANELLRVIRRDVAKVEGCVAFDDLVGIYNTMISLHNTMIGAEGRGDLR